jgi:hypothetical protein
MKFVSPIVIVGIGILLLFAGSSAANAEETAANAIGNFLQNKWVAIGIIVVGALLFASQEGLIKKAIS